jgi:membrane protein implicated in regulation of membrane protease activity
LRSGDDQVNVSAPEYHGSTVAGAILAALILIITLILALLFLPSPWNVLAVALAAVWEVCFAVVGIRWSRRRKSQVGVQTLVGKLGEASTALAPRGQVKINGEIWEARASQNTRAGDTVRVTHVDGLTLVVEPAEAT